MSRAFLKRYAWASLAAAIATIGLKGAAFWLTGSIGLLSDALESFVNFAGAIMVFVMLSVAERPPDEEHAFGHAKAEYFASGFEGALIVIAAISIVVTAADRLITPRPLEQAPIGLAVSAVATLINWVTARTLIRAGSRYRSIALEADGYHLMTDVWTSIGVIVGVAAVVITGWNRLDPLIALAVAAHIMREGARLMRNSVHGLMDVALPAEERRMLAAVLDAYQAQGARYHALRTRQAGHRGFVSVHVLVPGSWSVQRGHDLVENLEKDIRAALPHADVITHLEPIEDPAAYTDGERAR